MRMLPARPGGPAAVGNAQMSGYALQTPNDSQDEMSTISFIARRLIWRMSTMKLVQVQAVHGGGVAPAGTVDVLPLVQQIDGNGYGTPHGTVYGLPWSRLQGGKNAIICDPQVGDVGYVVAADRDISSTKAQAPGSTTTTGYVPGTRRQFHISDGIYAGGCLNVAPEQYVQFSDDGINIVSPTKITLMVGAHSLVIAPDGIVLDGIPWSTHSHAVTTAPGETGPPAP